jgi:hypothetical protein
MAFTVRDFSDLLRLLEAHPEWRRELRRVLFPEIDIPKALQELAEAQRRTEATVERLAAQMATGFMDATAARETGFAGAAAERQSIVEQMETGFAQAAAERQSIVERMEAGFSEAAAERKAMKHDLGRLKGLAHEQFYRERAQALFGRYLTRGRDVTEQIADQLQTACQAGELAEEEYTQVLAADLLWGGQLRDTKDEVVLVVEASWLVEATDIERAVARAAVLRRIGLKALPVVSGREWAQGAPEMARERGVVLADNGRIDPASWQAALSNS